jgi:NAD(P)-dependent dehydrogenase (short-subunit alcohol dehydrogenase family)
VPDIPCCHIGAASGIGKATVELLGKEGAKTRPVTIDAAVRERTRAADNEKVKG